MPLGAATVATGSVTLRRQPCASQQCRKPRVGAQRVEVGVQTEQTQQMSISFETTVSSSYTWSVSAGIKIGVSTTFETGIPFVAKGEVSVSTEISFNASYGQTHSVSEAFSYSAAVSVPAGATIQANATASSYQISGTYTANYTENWAHAGAISRQITGTIEGLSAYNVVVDYADVTTSNAIAAAQSGD